MREIKFRAFSKDEYLDPEDYFTLHNGRVLGKDGEDITDEVILMQYTGLKDKNGREIYEGDLFKPDNLVNPKALEVKYDETAAYFEPFGNSYDDSFTGSRGEVIGNIYENGELLAQENTNAE